MDARINLGDRVYLKIAIAGDPGCVVAFDRKGRALVDWSFDMPELNRWTAHDPSSLVVDESFTVRQLDLFDEIAA
jgi:hypothetical protein